MKNSKKQDEIFSQPLKEIKDFSFNETVADVFEDMITRSIPGYGDIVTMIGVLAKRYYQPKTICYDLGCSLGAVSLSIWEQLKDDACRIIAIDKSEAMIQRCQKRIENHNAEKQIELICADICNVDFKPSSFMALNFTLQFLPQDIRRSFLKKLYDGMTKGAALVISEKILLEPEHANQFQIDLYHTFKKIMAIAI
jgi:tRNA (cmo5U34)-methyltransferase